MKNLEFKTKLINLCKLQTTHISNNKFDSVDFRDIRQLILERFNINASFDFTTKAKKLTTVELDYASHINPQEFNDKKMAEVMNRSLKSDFDKLKQISRDETVSGSDVFSTLNGDEVTKYSRYKLEFLRELGAGKVDMENFKVITKNPVKVSITIDLQYLSWISIESNQSTAEVLAAVLIHNVGYVLNNLLYMFETGEYNVKLLHIMSEKDTNKKSDLLSKYFDIKLEKGEELSTVLNNYGEINRLIEKISKNTKEVSRKQAAFVSLADEFVIEMGLSAPLQVVIENTTVVELSGYAIAMNPVTMTVILLLFPFYGVVIEAKIFLLIIAYVMSKVRTLSDFRGDIKGKVIKNPEGSTAQRLSFAIASYVKVIRTSNDLSKADIKMLIHEATELENSFNSGLSLNQTSIAGTVLFIIMGKYFMRGVSWIHPFYAAYLSIVSIFSVIGFVKDRLGSNSVREYNKQLDDTIETILANNKLYLASWKLELLQGEK